MFGPGAKFAANCIASTPLFLRECRFQIFPQKFLKIERLLSNLKRLHLGPLIGGSVNIEKVFFIQEFLSSYPSVISNQRITNMKRTFIQWVKLFEEHSLIESNYKIISDGKVYQTDQLTSSNISEGFIVHEKLSI